jgi:hypothetical protein
MIPERVRTNMRYRGPMESQKEKTRTIQLLHSVAQLKKQVQELISGVASYKDQIRKGSKESTMENTIPFRMTHMQRDIKLIERGVRND